MSAAASQMQAVLSGATEALRALLALLEEEIERLRTRNIEGLEALLSRKLEAVQSLERLERERQDAVRAAGFSADPAGMQSYLDHCGDTALTSRWSELKALLQQVQLLNEANGNVINRSLSQVETQLALLRGEQPAAAGETYGPGGNTRGRSGGREISRA